MNKALSETRDKLFDARYLIEGMRLAVENMSDEDEMKCLIQSLAKVAVEKIDAAMGSAILDPPATKREMDRARAYMEKTGASTRPSEAA